MSVHFISEPDPALGLSAQQRDAAGKPTPQVCDAFTALYEHSKHLIYNFFCLKLGNEQDAQELTQETFARAWRALPAKDPGPLCCLAQKNSNQPEQGLLAEKANAPDFS